MMFWFTVFGAPCVALGVYTSLFIGDAKLAPIPEGYEPQEYEYERNPITRWLKKHYWVSEQEKYEVTLHLHWEMYNQVCKKQLMREVERQMKDEGDYAGWYYIPYDSGRTRMMNNIREEWYEK